MFYFNEENKILRAIICVLGHKTYIDLAVKHSYTFPFLSNTVHAELTECIGSTIKNWVTEADKNELQYATSIQCLNKKFLEKLEQDERGDFKLTVKIFLGNIEKGTLEEAIDKALCELGTSYIETVLLSLPDNKRNLENLKTLWESLEDCVSKEKVFSIGVAELSTEQLVELYTWAKVKPCVAQVNLQVCCVVPPEMQEFAKQHDIQLLTHNDPSDILPLKSWQEVLLQSFTTADVEGWETSWVVRYSVLIKTRGIIKTKGYITKAQRNILKKRK